MDIDFAKELCKLNNHFYRTWATSFSSTRHNIWPGCVRCLIEAGLTAKHSKQPYAQFSPQHLEAAPKTQNCTNSSSIVKGPTGESEASETDAQNLLEAESETLQLLDVACGNLRFEEFLAETLPNKSINALALDSCDEMALPRPISKKMEIEFKHCDVMHELQEGNLDTCLSPIASHGLNKAKTQELQLPKQSSKSSIEKSLKADLTVSFGFMHHIPLPEWRVNFIKALLQATKPNGCVCLSFWKFMNSRTLAAKANKTHAKGITELGYRKECFNKGDYLLGWRNEPGAYRYCHSFSDEEIDGLIKEIVPSATLVSRFTADGRTGNLNEYLVLKSH